VYVLARLQLEVYVILGISLSFLSFADDYDLFQMSKIGSDAARSQD